LPWRRSFSDAPKNASVRSSTPGFDLPPRVEQVEEPAHVEAPGDEAAAGELRPITVRMRCGASPRSPMTCSNAITRTLPSDLSVSKLAIVIFTCEVAY